MQKMFCLFAFLAALIAGCGRDHVPASEHHVVVAYTITYTMDPDYTWNVPIGPMPTVEILLVSGRRFQEQVAYLPMCISNHLADSHRCEWAQEMVITDDSSGLSITLNAVRGPRIGTVVVPVTEGFAHPYTTTGVLGGTVTVTARLVRRS